MAHVEIRSGDDRTSLTVIVDGVDLTAHIFKEGFGLVRVGEGSDAEWGVRMIVAPDVLDIDLPDAVLQATIEDLDEASA